MIATGKTHTIREFCEIAFGEVGLNYEDYLKLDERFLRPAEVDILVGDPSKAQSRLGWQEQSTFEDLVIEMVHADLAQAKRFRGGRCSDSNS